MAERLPCGHPAGWMLRLRDGPVLYKYCWGCILEKCGVKEVFPKTVEKEIPKKVSKVKVED